MFIRRGLVIEQEIHSSPLQFCFCFFLNEMWNSSVSPCRNYYTQILPFPLLPSKDKVGKIVYIMLHLGKGKLRKRMHVYIDNPDSCISYLQRQILAKFFYNAKTQYCEELSQLSTDTQVFRMVKNWSFLTHAFPAEVKQGSDLLSCFDFHVVNKCTFHDVCHI